MRKWSILFTGLAWMLVCSFPIPVASEEEQSQQEEQSQKAVVKKLADGKYLIGSVLVDKNAQEIHLPGKVNMQEGLIELFACGPRGKLHERVLVLDVVPYHLQVALLLLGLEPGGGLDYQGDPGIPAGDPVVVWVEWEQSDSLSSSSTVAHHRAEELIYNIAREQPMDQTHWVFVDPRSSTDGLWRR